MARRAQAIRPPPPRKSRYDRAARPRLRALRVHQRVRLDCGAEAPGRLAHSAGEYRRGALQAARRRGRRASRYHAMGTWGHALGARQVDAVAVDDSAAGVESLDSESYVDIGHWTLRA